MQLNHFAPLQNSAKVTAKSLISLECGKIWWLELSNPGDQAVVLRAEKLLAEAIAAMDNQDWLRANALLILKEGLDAVGYRYVRPITPDFALLDDTGLALGAAFYSDKQSRFDQAAHLRKGVLSDRFWLLREKLRAETVR